jgi:hypothetical protein
MFIQLKDVSKTSFERVLRDSAFEIGEHFRSLRQADGNTDVPRIQVSYKDTVKQIIEKFTAYTQCDFEITRDLIAKYMTGMSYADILQKMQGVEQMCAKKVNVVTLKAAAKSAPRPAAVPAKPIGVSNKQSSEVNVYAGMSVKCKELIMSLKTDDQALYFNYREKFAAWSAELDALLRLSNEIKLRQEKETTTYGSSMVVTLADLLGIPDSSLWTGVSAVKLFSLERLLDAVSNITKSGNRITVSHLRQLCRLSSEDWLQQREELLDRIINGELISYRNVEAAVDKILNRTQTVLSADPAKVDQIKNDISDVYTDDSNEPSALDGDAMLPLAPPSEFSGLCKNMNANVRVFSDKFSKWSDQLLHWQEDAPIESLETVDVNLITETTDQLLELVRSLESTVTYFQEVAELAAQTRKPKEARRAPVNGKQPVDEEDSKLAYAGR